MTRWVKFTLSWGPYPDTILLLKSVFPVLPFVLVKGGCSPMWVSFITFHDTDLYPPYFRLFLKSFFAFLFYPFYNMRSFGVIGPLNWRYWVLLLCGVKTTRSTTERSYSCIVGAEMEVQPSTWIVFACGKIMERTDLVLARTRSSKVEKIKRNKCRSDNISSSSSAKTCTHSWCIFCTRNEVQYH